ncbi:MAG TPA: GNAT family N-acetyltransferase [Thermomicrobiales bacterium]|nr:GNAT family N-acetyltransferase [Thermomicrobiales bacterium]
MPRRDLGSGLVLRDATPDDVDALAAFNARFHEGPGELIAAWTRDLFDGHPACRPEDFTVVEDTAAGRIVSSLALIAQTWTYGGVPFGVGRVELVGTDEAYGRRGLARALLDVLHARSRARGEPAQAITGIPWYYRQFGYEYALPLDGGERAPRRLLPAPATDAPGAYRVRPATAADAPFIAATDARGRARYLVAAALWRYEIAGRGERARPWTVEVIEPAAGGGPVGFVVCGRLIQGGALTVRACELAPGVGWLAVSGDLLPAPRRPSRTGAG